MSGISTRLLALLALLPAPALAQTMVPGGNLVGSATWTPAGSPYVLLGDVTVPAATTLTIQAGVEVRFGPGDTQGSFDTARTELRVAGSLSITGTTMSPVLFTSGAASPATGDYFGLVLLAGSSANIAGLTARYGHRCVADQTAGTTITNYRAENCGYGLEVAGGTPTITNSTIQSSTSYGIYGTTSANITATGLTVINNTSYGIYTTDAGLTLSQSVIRGNGSRGLYLRTTTGTHNTSVTKSTIYANGSYGIYVNESSGTLNSTIRDNVIISNGSYGIYVNGLPSITASHNLVYNHSTNYYGLSGGTGAVSENPLLVDITNGDFRPTSRSGARFAASDGTDLGAFPYDGALTPSLTGHLYQNTVLSAAGSPHTVTGDLTVEPGVTLTIEPGAEVRFTAGSDEMFAGTDNARIELIVEGTLVADGTQSSGIRFRSTGGSPIAGDWYGIRLVAGASASVIDYATIQHARYAVHSSASASTIVQRSTIESSSSYGLYVDAGTIELAGLTVRNNSSYGIYVTDASASIENSLIHDNGSRGVYLRTTTGTHNTELIHNTIVGNGSYGVYLNESSGTMNVTVRDNLIVANGSYGIYVNGLPSVTSSYNLVWDQSTNYSGLSGGTGAVTENPLLVNTAARDLRVTSNSPTRRHASDGGEIGAIPFDGAATVGVHGHLYENTTWSGTVDVLGDVTIEPGVTLTIQSGAIIRFAAGLDSMISGTDTSLTELIALGRLVVDGTPGSRATLTSSALAPMPGQWYGVRLTSSAASSSIDNAIIEFARYGVHSQAPSSTSLSQSEVRRSSSYGVYVDGGALVLDGVVIHDNTSYGLYATDASPTMTNLVIHENGSRGLYLRSTTGTQNMVANGCTIWGNGSYGAYINESSGTLNVTLRNSIISENGSYGIYINGLPSVTLNNNDVWGQSTNYSGVSAGPGSISANPNFVDVTLDNFHLLPSSPAIDGADPMTAVDHDLEGGVRPLDGDGNMTVLPDMGAFEFNTSGNRWPIADGGPDRVVTSGLSATFSGAGSLDFDGTITTWVWDFGDGTPMQSGMTVTHTFAGGTDRTVTLTVTDNAGAIDVDTVAIEVNLPPIADAGADRYADPGELVSFSAVGSTDSDGTIATYVWTFGDGATATGSSVTHQYSTGGDYTVTLVVTDDDGASTTDTTVAHITGADGAAPMIVHTQITGPRPANTAITVSADITDTSGVGAVTLYYQTTGAGAFSNVAMSNVAGSTYQATIPAGAVASPGVTYYIRAVDSSSAMNAGTSPAGAPGTAHSFSVDAPIGPSIAHVQIGDGQPAGAAVNVTAVISAGTPIASATLYYRAMGGGSFTGVVMTAAMSNYSAQIPASAVNPPAVEYYLEAVDSAVPANTVTDPPGAGSVHSFTVTAADTSAPAIVHTPIADGRPEGMDVEVTATITDASNVTAASLRYRVRGSGSFASVPMTAGAANSWTAVIPGASVTQSGVDYYLSATDGAMPANTGTDPAGAPGAFHTFTAVRMFDVMPGDLVVTEIMNDPSGTETQREWFEIYNTTSRALALDGLELLDDGSDSFTIASPMIVAPGAYFVLGRSADTAMNGGARVDYVYTGFALSNADDEIVIRAGGVEIDRVNYDDGVSFPDMAGRSKSLDPGELDFTSNDDGAAWCSASSQLSGGDYGTPGAVNDPCTPLVDTTPPALVHTPLGDGQPANTAVIVALLATDASGIGAVEVFYRAAGSGAFSSVTATNLAGSSEYRATIPAGAVTLAGVEYYVQASDAAQPANVVFHPAAGASAPHQFDVSADDRAGPAIIHVPIAGSRPAGQAVAIVATILDASGIASATLYHRPGGGGPFVAVPMADGGNGVFAGEIPGNKVLAPGVDYYISAADASTAGNVGEFPAQGAAMPQSFVVEGVDEDPPEIMHTAIGPDQPSGRAVTVEATVTDLSGVAEVLLYHRPGGSATFTAVALSDAGGNIFRGEIPAAGVTEAGVDYYLEASDASNAQNLGRLPAAAPGEVFSFTVRAAGDDRDPPAILHLPPPDGRPAGTAVDLVFEIVDASGVSAARVLYRTRGASSFVELALVREAGTDRWTARIPREAVEQPAIEYYVEATDAAGNVAKRPNAAPAEVFAFTVSADEGPDPRAEASGCACSSAAETTRASAPSALLLLAVFVARRRRRR